MGNMAVFAVLLSIEFNDHFRTVASKIDDVAIEGDLPPKMEGRLFEFTQSRPKNAFRIGLVAAQRPCERICQSDTPTRSGFTPLRYVTPARPPRKGEVKKTRKYSRKDMVLALVLSTSPLRGGRRGRSTSRVGAPHAEWLLNVRTYTDDGASHSPK